MDPTQLTTTPSSKSTMPRLYPPLVVGRRSAPTSRDGAAESPRQVSGENMSVFLSGDRQIAASTDPWAIAACWSTARSDDVKQERDGPVTEVPCAPPRWRKYGPGPAVLPHLRIEPPEEVLTLLSRRSESARRQ